MFISNKFIVFLNSVSVIRNSEPSSSANFKLFENIVKKLYPVGKKQSVKIHPGPVQNRVVNAGLKKKIKLYLLPIMESLGGLRTETEFSSVLLEIDDNFREMLLRRRKAPREIFTNDLGILISAAPSAFHLF